MVAVSTLEYLRTIINSAEFGDFVIFELISMGIFSTFLIIVLQNLSVGQTIYFAILNV